MLDTYRIHLRLLALLSILSAALRLRYTIVEVSLLCYLLSTSPLN